MTQTWFISDMHLGHSNIIKFCNRPFKDVWHMNNTLIKNWNNRVKPEDTVFHVGDFCFSGKGLPKAEDYIKQLNGRIVFIKGNHDDNNTLKTDIHSLILSKGGRNFYIVHNPEDREPGMINIVGHVHKEFKFKTLDGIDCINVGVDQWAYRPITFNEMMKEYSKWKKNVSEQ